MTGTFQDVVLAEGASSIDMQPFVHTGTVKMVATRKLSKFNPVIISRKADATFLQFATDKFFRLAEQRMQSVFSNNQVILSKLSLIFLNHFIKFLLV